MYEKNFHLTQPSQSRYIKLKSYIILKIVCKFYFNINHRIRGNIPLKSNNNINHGINMIFIYPCYIIINDFLLSTSNTSFFVFWEGLVEESFFNFKKRKERRTTLAFSKGTSLVLRRQHACLQHGRPWFTDNLLRILNSRNVWQTF